MGYPCTHRASASNLFILFFYPRKPAQSAQRPENRATVTLPASAAASKPEPSQIKRPRTARDGSSNFSQGFRSLRELVAHVKATKLKSTKSKAPGMPSRPVQLTNSDDPGDVWYFASAAIASSEIHCSQSRVSAVRNTGTPTSGWYIKDSPNLETFDDTEPGSLTRRRTSTSAITGKRRRNAAPDPAGASAAVVAAAAAAAVAKAKGAGDGPKVWSPSATNVPGASARAKRSIQPLFLCDRAASHQIALERC